MPSAESQKKEVDAGCSDRQQGEHGSDQSLQQGSPSASANTGRDAVRHHVDDDIGRDAEDRAMSERCSACKSRQDVDRHCQNAEDQHFGCKADLIVRQAEWQQRRNDDGDRLRSTVFGWFASCCFPEQSERSEGEQYGHRPEDDEVCQFREHHLPEGIQRIRPEDCRPRHRAGCRARQ